MRQREKFPERKNLYCKNIKAQKMTVKLFIRLKLAPR